MNVALITMNSSYTHTGLAVHSLNQSIIHQTEYKPKIIELTVNGPYDELLSKVFECKPDVLCFSCYIWNVELIENIMADIKKVLPDVTIVCGGPEVSYDGTDFIKKNSAVDFVMSGEGEEALPLLLKQIENKTQDFIPANVTYSNKNEIIGNKTTGVINDLDLLPFPYSKEYIKENNNKIFYYETSRGCPYACSYCISSIEKSYRTKSLGKVFDEIEVFYKRHVKLLKFTDRTFNADRKRACDILKHIAGLDTDMLFHFEIAGDILDDCIIDILKNMPINRVQLEAGFQSTNEQTIKAINRKISYEKSSEYLMEIIKNGNIHVHTDLIAGLPHEDMVSFAKSFNDVYHIGGHHLQLGFLKLLKGTKIKDEYDQNDSCYSDKPPYEILKTPWLKYDDVLSLKHTEHAVERFYNSSNFSYTIEYILQKGLMKPFELYQKLGTYMKLNGYLDRPLSAFECYDVFIGFTNESCLFDQKDKDMIFCFIKADMVSSFIFRKIPQKYKDMLKFLLIKNNNEIGDMKRYFLDDLSVQVLNQKGEEQMPSPYNGSVFINAIEIDYSAKHSVIGRFPSRFIHVDT